MVAVTGDVLVFTAVKAGKLTVPLAAKPMEEALFVQLYTIVLPVVGLVKVTAAIDVAAQATLLAMAATVAVGFTVMVNVEAVPVQLTPPLV